MPPTPNPYAPPFPGLPAAPITAPAAVVWARIYAGAFALMYLLCGVGGIVLLAMGSSFDGPNAERTMLQALVMVIAGFPLMIVSIVTAFAPRRKWGWVLNIVLIGLGLTSCMCAAAAIPLLIFWLKPDVKAWYGINATGP